MTRKRIKDTEHTVLKRHVVLPTEKAVRVQRLMFLNVPQEATCTNVCDFRLSCCPGNNDSKALSERSTLGSSGGSDKATNLGEGQKSDRAKRQIQGTEPIA